MHTDIVPFPAGAWEGVVSLRCEIDATDPLTPGQLRRIRGLAGAGVQLIWIHTDRWGDEAFDRFMLDLANDDRLSDFMITAIRPLTAARWSALDIEWIIDVSDVFSLKKMTIETIRESAQASAVVPRMRELIWREPDIENVTPASLEAIADHLQPTVQAWLYVENDELAKKAFAAAARAHALWGLRRTIGETWPIKM